MNKTLKICICFLMLVNLLVFAKNKQRALEDLTIDLETIEVLTQGEEARPTCHSGGVYATSCSIDAGVDLGEAGFAGGCSVSCESGKAYACCHKECKCIPY